MKRRIPQYFLGLVFMALGVVFIKRAEIGISPLSAIPAAISNITPLTLGNTTIIFHVCLVLIQMIIMRKVTLKTVLIFPLSIAFGYLIDLFMLIFNFAEIALVLRCFLCALGIIATALGIVVVVGADLMLPAPDAILRQISAQFSKPLPTVKIIGDVTWVIITIAIELISCGKIISIGIGTLVSMYLTGKLVGVFKKLMPFWEMKPTSIK